MKEAQRNVSNSRQANALLYFKDSCPAEFICSKSRMETLKQKVNPANIYLFKVNNRNTRKRCEIYTKLTMKTLERRQ